MAEGIFCGRGGQGVLRLARYFGLAAARLGYEVSGEELRGVAVRGGSVSASVRIGPFASASIAAGGADFLLSLHPEETGRNLSFLRPGGLMVADGKSAPQRSPGLFRTALLDASALSRDRLGHGIFAGQILLGRLFAELSPLFPEEELLSALLDAPGVAPRALALGAETLRPPRYGSQS